MVQGVAGVDRAGRVKHAGDVDDLKVGARLTGLVRDAQLHGVIDHFVRLLDLAPGDLQRLASDIDGHLVPRLRALKSPIAIFIDGVDEYFSKHVEDQPVHASVTGELSPNVWHFSQLGLVEVAYQLRRINHHLKVFAAIRKEAYASLPRRTSMAQQYRERGRHRLLARGAARDLHQQRATGEDHPHGEARPRGTIRWKPFSAAPA